ncbi:carbonic anhydrase [Paenibacillus sp. UNC499MF]|uniref:beta-class carbonic anhydrase n=1 Tax=Paenibacillus sp. UNC499MF TaxID=1502751 RepID=UPI0008A01380|nr:carbonic anhydrase [Paenibacillus sp. UNC499MF]SEG75024.1 carbonic anhydrase [Paenibacillus sp. UNC499MF]
MSSLNEVLARNRIFLKEKQTLPLPAPTYPDTQLVILTCTDIPSPELLPRALGIRNEDAKVIKNAGAVVSHPSGTVLRSILLAICESKAREVFVIGHRDCRIANLRSADDIECARGFIDPDPYMRTLSEAVIDLNGWLSGFSSMEESIANSVSMIRSHPLFPESVLVHGLVIDPVTGRLNVVVEGKVIQPKEGVSVLLNSEAAGLDATIQRGNE